MAVSLWRIPTSVESLFYYFFILFAENALTSNTSHSSANLVMTPQGQLLTLKGPLFSGPVVAVSSALLDADLKPQVASSTMAQSGMWWYPLWLGNLWICSVVIQSWSVSICLGKKSSSLMGSFIFTWD